MLNLGTAVRALPGVALNALLPPRCLVCGVGVDRPGSLCGSCWRGLSFMAPPFCVACGFPFDYDLGAGTLCGACHREPPVYDRARAVLRYDELSRGLLLGFKHGDRTEGAPAFGEWLARAGAELIADCDVILPVPLHRRRLFSRRYNQSALLAQALGRAAGLPVLPDSLRRARNTPSQGRLSAAARQRNVAGAFRIAAGAADRLGGRRVLLVDDVLTTGVTVEACARTLKRAGAAGVDVLTLARVVRPQQA
jgi:ComF family protein